MDKRWASEVLDFSLLCCEYTKTSADGEPDTGYVGYALNKDAVSGAVSSEAALY